MGIQTYIVIADLEAAKAIADSATPTAQWEGFAFDGFDHRHLCALLSLGQTGHPSAELKRYLKMVETVAVRSEEGPTVAGVKPDLVAELAVLASLEGSDLESVASMGAATEEFDGWSVSDLLNLLRKVGGLAESASLQGKWLMLWQPAHASSRRT